MVLFLGNKKVNESTQASLPLFLSHFPVPFFSLPLTFWNMEVEHTFEKKKQGLCGFQGRGKFWCVVDV